MIDYHDSVELSDKSCPKCGAYPTHRRDCGCYDGYSHHDCGEDCCCCLDPEPNVVCDECDGNGCLNWCPKCGWDLLQNRFINGRDEREPT